MHSQLNQVLNTEKWKPHALSVAHVRTPRRSGREGGVKKGNTPWGCAYRLLWIHERAGVGLMCLLTGLKDHTFPEMPP